MLKCLIVKHQRHGSVCFFLSIKLPTIFVIKLFFYVFCFVLFWYHFFLFSFNKFWKRETNVSGRNRKEVILSRLASFLLASNRGRFQHIFGSAITKVTWNVASTPVSRYRLCFARKASLERSAEATFFTAPFAKSWTGEISSLHESDVASWKRPSRHRSSHIVRR